MSEYRITDVARLTGTNTSTLRLWEQHGLLSPKRSTAGQRIFDNTDIERIRVIQRMRKVDGLNMSAIRKALNDPAHSGRSKDELGSQERRTPPQGDDSVSLGVRFRLARQKAKMSLRDAEEASGLPISFISTFERTSQGATVASLQMLASCYGTTITEQTGSGVRRMDREIIVRVGKERVLPNFGPSISILQLAESISLLDCQKWILQPGAESNGSYAHEGEEFIHVLSGVFRIWLDGAENVLKAGDSIAFESQRSHAWKADGDEPTVLIWVNTPKSF